MLSEFRSLFVMIHTFAHLLINQLAFDCVYGSVSLENDFTVKYSQILTRSMAYSASGDAEGIMESLVRPGEPNRLTIQVKLICIVI